MTAEGREQAPWFPRCRCGLNLNIWKNPWNHENWCEMEPLNLPPATASKHTSNSPIKD